MFLHKLEQKVEEKFDDSSCSNFFGKSSTSFCVEMKWNERGIWWKKAKKLIELVDWITDEHFAMKSILRQLGWCAQQLLQKRILNYKKEEELVKRVYLVELYWFNSSTLHFGKKETESSLICNCNYSNFFFHVFSSSFLLRNIFFGYDFFYLIVF